MRERFLVGLLIGCIAGALCAPLFAQQNQSTGWNRLFVQRKAVALSGVTIARVAQVATATYTAHGLVTGDRVTIAAADQTEYNGTFTITRTGADTFTYTVTGSPATPATGTITANFTGGTPVPWAADSSGNAIIVF
jgi:hypothetical protein